MTDRERDSLLAGVKKAIVTWGGNIRRTYGDDHGDYAVRFHFRESTFIGVAKKYADADRASFMQSVVRRAAGQDILLAEFFGEQPTLSTVYVFLPVTVLEVGRESQGLSKKDVMTDWYELDLDHGVMLGDFVSGRGAPPRPPAEATRPVRIQDYA